MTKFMKHSGQSGSVRKIGKKLFLLLGVTLAALLSFSCKQDASNDGDDNSPKTFDIVYELDGGTNHADNPKKYSTDKLPVELKDPEKTGFDFKGWYKDKDFKNKVEKIEKGITGKLTLYAKWSEIKSESYTVIHLWQPVTGDTYFEHERETPSGKVGAETTAAAKTYTGFHVSKELHTGGKIIQEKIKADGTTVVKIHYDRDMFTAKFNTDGGNAIPERSCRYETEILPPAPPIKDGFTFIGWEPTLPAKLMANTEYKAKWTAEVLPEYKVQHWLQKLDGNGKACDASHKDNTCYELKDTDTKNGKKGEQTQAAAKDYTGFTSTGVVQEDINENGSTVVKIYYVRKDITLTFDAQGGTISGQPNKILSGKYGEKIESNAVPNPLRNADEFGEWKPVKPTAFPEKDTTYEAQWKTLISIKIEQEPTKKDYIVGDDFDNKGLVVKAKYSDGSNPTLRYNVDYETNFDSIKNAVGENKTVTVNHKKDTSKIATFTVNIKAPVPTFSAGDIIDKSGKKTKIAEFTLPAGANWKDYYVIISRSGTKYIGAQYATSFNYILVSYSAPSTYSNIDNVQGNRVLNKEDVHAILGNKAAFIKAIKKTGCEPPAEFKDDFGAENILYNELSGWYDGNDARQYGGGKFLPIMAREFE
ncbi:MAG: InlB B-repeat-containing protein [Treponema sp.]